MSRIDALRGDDGFTLIELLVALCLMSLLMLLVYGGLSFGTRAWEKTEGQRKGADAIRFAQELVRNDLARGYPRLMTSDPAHPAIAFAGEAGRIAWITTAPEGHRQVELWAEQGAEGWSLMRRTTPELARAGESAASSRALLRGAQEIRFSYYGSARGDTPRAWNASWSGVPRPPELIRIEILFPPGDVRRWASLIVAPRIAADVACRYDPLTKYCIGR